MVRDNNLVRIDAPSLTGLRGTLCKVGRFELLEQSTPRVTMPFLRNNRGEHEECSMDIAVQRIKQGFGKSRHDFAGLSSSRLPLETLSLFKRFILDSMGGEFIDTLDGAYYRAIKEGIRGFGEGDKDLNIECSIEEIPLSDCIIVIGADPETTNPVVGNLICRAVGRQKANLIVINSARDVFPLRSDLWLRPRSGSEEELLIGLMKVVVDECLASSRNISEKLKEYLGRYEMGEIVRTTGIEIDTLRRVAEKYTSAERGLIIYGNSLTDNSGPAAVTAVLNMVAVTGNMVDAALRVISLKPSANSRGAWEMGLARGIAKSKPSGLYLLLSDDTADESLLDWLRGIEFLVVQASYHSPATVMADVVLPSRIWAEREGIYINMDGRSLDIHRVLKPVEGLPSDDEILMVVSRKLGKELVLR
jgi:predicted molibdopterin-dependent oxidoreductase YjgC